MDTKQANQASGRAVALNGRKFQDYINVDSPVEVLYLAQAIRREFRVNAVLGEPIGAFEGALQEFVKLGEVDPSVAKLKIMKLLLSTPTLCDRSVANEFLLNHIEQVIQRRSGS
jgi:hypothetical protein